MKILRVVELINMVTVSDFKIVSETYRLQKYTKEFTKEKVTNTLNPRTLFSLCCTHDTD
jgi:hypothetical protein